MTAAKTKAKPDPVDEDFDESLLTTAPDDWEFETVAEESPTVVIFDNIGDAFIGQYTGIEHIDQPVDDQGNDQSFDRLRFVGRDGNPYAINTSFKLKEAFEDVDEGMWVRITYVKDIPTGRKLNPMKDFKVEVRRS